MIKKPAILLGVGIWIVATLLYSEYSTFTGSHTSIGFPWRFFSHKPANAPLSAGEEIEFIIEYLLLDVIIALIIVMLLNFILAKTAKAIKHADL
ncbi:hypothetical protein FPZ43_10600 [Mucilaginibacter pallidiroseus]|uniref:Uncharacterized protein n=1 Tax=Mucilaginibacter pallidiroseus TaxID=2599295 RepID=A0A563UDN2_9SPHI|nr:hypothetical protein [Mucilaginibacter pallidiroseus]TWR29393.1 hypothetical protein FPZ43_10600 [Mucilaginibacter pallidiroseus]